MQEQSGQEPSDKAVDEAIGAELRRIRDGLGLSRPDVVERMQADIHWQSLANYEYGIRPCTVHRLADICAALGVDPGVVVTVALSRASRSPQITGAWLGPARRNMVLRLSDGRLLAVDVVALGVGVANNVPDGWQDLFELTRLDSE